MKWLKERKYCFELQSSYDESKVNDGAECKQKCYLDEKCLVLEFRADQLVCKLSDQWRFKKERKCINYFVKVLAALESHRWLYFEYSKLLRYVFIDLKKCPVHGEICQENAECNDTSETYQCLCKPGYEQDYDGKCIKGWYVIR